MARKGRVDRGLLQKQDAEGKKIWYVRLHHEGKERRFGSFSTKTAARDFYNKAKLDQKTGRFFPERYQQGGYELVATVIDRCMAVSTVKNQYAEKNYARWWKNRLEGKRVNAITPDAIDAAVWELSVRLAPQTVLHYCKFLRRILNRGVRDGWLERNPFARVTFPSVTARRTRFLSPEEEARLLQQLGPTYGPWARLAILTGLRQAEQFSSRWADLDIDHGMFTLPATKAGEVQYVRLNEEAKGILRCMQAVREAESIAEPRKRNPWVFPSESGSTSINPRSFYTRIYIPAVNAAGLSGVNWHCLRHTYASRLAMNGATESTIAALLRHSGTALVARYAHLSPSHLQAAVEGVATFGKLTVTETGMEKRERKREEMEVIETVSVGEVGPTPPK